MKVIRQKTETRFCLDGGVLSKTPKDIEITKYNHEGEKISCQSRNISKRTTRIEEYEYGDGRLHRMCIYEPRGVLKYTIDHMYNNSQLSHEKMTSIGGAIIFETTYTYNSQSLLVKRIHTSYSMQDRFVDDYVYDSYGRLIYEKSISKMLGKEITIYRYNEQGKLSEECYSINHKPISKHTYAYDRKGRKEQVVYIDHVDKKSGYTLTEEFSRRGQPLYEKHYTNGRLTSTDRYEYNKHGHMTSHYVKIYDCDCMGVREIPLSLTKIGYQYW